jgi:hypothetical protein
MVINLKSAKDEERKKEREPMFLFHEFCDVAKMVSIPKQIFALIDNTYVKNGNCQNNTSRHKCDDCAGGKKTP